MRRAAIMLSLLCCRALCADDALVVTAQGDRLSAGNGGGASVLWVRSGASGNVTAGATFFSLPGTRWAYATAGGMRRVNARTMLAAEANLGRGNDAAGGFGYLLLRGGATRELLAKRLYGEAEWLQIDVARQQDGIARAGVTFLPVPPLALRASLYESLTGDNDTTLVTFRGDYDFGRFRAIGGFYAGRATPVLLQQSGAEAARVREAFAGVAVDDWTLVVSAGSDRRRLSLSWRVPLQGGVR